MSTIVEVKSNRSDSLPLKLSNQVMLRTVLFVLALCSLFAPPSAFADIGNPGARDQLDGYGVVNTAKRRATAISTFDRYLLRTKVGARVSSCSTLLFSHLGEVEDVYVGDCRLTDGQRVALCADTGVGEFGLNFYLYGSYGLNGSHLATFSKLCCPGG